MLADVKIGPSVVVLSSPLQYLYLRPGTQGIREGVSRRFVSQLRILKVISKAGAYQQRWTQCKSPSVHREVPLCPFRPLDMDCQKAPRPSNPLTSTRVTFHGGDTESTSKVRQTPPPQHHGSRFPQFQRIRCTDPKQTLRGSDVPRRCIGDPPRPTTLSSHPATRPVWTQDLGKHPRGRQSALRPFASHRCTRTTQEHSNVLLVLGP